MDSRDWIGDEIVRRVRRRRRAQLIVEAGTAALIVLAVCGLAIALTLLFGDPTTWCVRG